MNKHKLIKTLVVATCTAALYSYQRRKKLAALALVAPVAVSSQAYAQMNETLVKSYAQSMQMAANKQNVAQIARLIADDVVISLNRQGRGSATLDKSGYLDLLQKSWSQSQNYRYQTSVDNIVITGDTARVQIVTKEDFDKDGKHTTLTTSARATLGVDGGSALLLRSVAQVTVE